MILLSVVEDLEINYSNLQQSLHLQLKIIQTLNCLLIFMKKKLQGKNVYYIILNMVFKHIQKKNIN